MFFRQPPASLGQPSADETWALETMLEEEAKMTPCPPNVLPIYKVQVKRVGVHLALILHN